MACENKKTRRLCKIILCLMFCGLPLVATRNIDCKGKPFHCVNSTHFLICVDLGGGISSTVDDFIIPCPESTICDINNYFECEFPPPTTLTLPIQLSDVSNESGLGKNKVITKVSWENIDITTTSPVQKTSDRSEKYLNNVSITILEEFTTSKAKLEAITDNPSTTIQLDNINIHYQNNNNERQYQQFTGEIIKDENTKGAKSNSYTIDIKPTQTNEEFEDRKLSSVVSGTESIPLQNSMSSPNITEFYSYTPGNWDVITFDSSFTTNSEMPTSDVMSANTPILPNSRSKSSEILKSKKGTTPHAVTAATVTESKNTTTVDPEVITLFYNSSNSPSQVNNDHSPAEVTLNESNPVNFVKESMISTIEARTTSRKFIEYQSSNFSNDTDKMSYVDEVSVTESFKNITPRVSEKYLQSNSTQDHLSSIVSKHLEPEQLNNTMDKYKPKNTTNIIEDITTKPNITEVQKGSANQENSDMSVSNSMRTNKLMYTTDKQALIEPINNSYINVSDNNKEMSNSIKNSQNLHDTDKIIKSQSNAPVGYTQQYQDNSSVIISSHDTPEEEIVWHQTLTKTTVPYNHNGTAISEYDSKNYVVNRDKLYSTTHYDSYSEITLKNSNNSFGDHKVTTFSTTTEQNIKTVTTAFLDYKIQNNKEKIKTNMSKTHEQVTVENEKQKKITIPYIYNGTTTSNLSNKNYVNKNSYSNNQYKSTQAMGELNPTNSDDLKNENTSKNSTNDFPDDKSIYTTIEPNVGVITTTDLTYKFMNKEIAKKELLNSAITDDLKSEIFYNNAASGFENKVIINITKPDIQTIKTAPNYNLIINKEEATNNLLRTDEKGAVMQETQKNITTSFIQGEIAMTSLNNNSYTEEDGSSTHQYQSTQTTNFKNDEVIVIPKDSNIDMITTTVPNYNLKISKEEATDSPSRTHEKSAVMQEAQKNITSFIQGKNVMTVLNNKSYAREDSISKNQYQFTQSTNSGNDKFIVTSTELNYDMITTTVPNYTSQKNKEETTTNMSKTHEEGVLRHETQKNITTPFIHGGKAMTDLNKKSHAKEDSSSKNQFLSTQTTNSRNIEVIVTTADSNIDMITTTVPNYRSQKNKEESLKNMTKTYEEGVVRHETQNITTPFIHSGKAMSDLNNKSYAKDDSSNKNQFQSTETTNSGNDEVKVTTSDSNIDMITTTVPNYNLKINKEETTENPSRTHEKSAVMQETQKNFTSFIQGKNVMTVLNNKSYAREDSISKNQYQFTQTTNSSNDKFIVTSTELNYDMITTTVPNYTSQKNKEETTTNMSKTHEEGVLRHETQKNITTPFIHGGKAMTDLNKKSHAKEDSSSKNQFLSTQTTNSGNIEIIVTTADSSIDMITTTVPNYRSQKNKEESIKNMTKTHEEDVVRHETQNITTPFIHSGKAMSDLNNKSYAKDDSSNKNQFQSTQTTNSGNDEVKVTTSDLNIDMMTTTAPNYYYQENKEGTIKNMSMTHEEGVVRHETQKNITTPLIHDGKAMSDLNDKSYAKDDSSNKNQFQATQTTYSGNDEVKVITSDSNIDMITTTVPNYKSQKNEEESIKNMTKTHEEGVVKHETQNITTPFIHSGKAMSDLNNKSYAKDANSKKKQFQSPQTTISGNDELKVTTSDSNIDMITTTVPNYNLKINKEEATENPSRTHEKSAVMQETQKNLTSFIQGNNVMTVLNNKSYAIEDSISKNQYQSTQITNFGNDKFIVTSTELNYDMITTTVPNYTSQTTTNMSKTHEKGVLRHETQKNITTPFIHGGKAMTDLNNKSYAKEDSNIKNQFQSTQNTNFENIEVLFTTADSNIDMITTAVPNYKSQENKEETIKNVSITHDEGVIRRETQKNITTPFIHGGKALSDLNNKTYAKDDSSNKNHFQSTQTTISGNDEVKVTTADSNIDMITTTAPNYNLKINKEETTENPSKTHEKSAVMQETQKNFTSFIQGKNFMTILNNKSYAREDSISKNQYQFTQTTNSGNDKFIVTSTELNYDMITTTVPNYTSQKNKKEITKNMSKTHEEGVVRHEAQKNITTPFIHGGKAMSDLNIKSYAKDYSSNKNQFQSTQTTISGNDEVKVTSADSNIDMMTTTVPNYYFQENKEGTIKNMSITHEEGVIRHETQKNIKTPFIHGGKALSDLNNKTYAKDDSSNKNQFQATQTTISGNDEVKVTTADANIDIMTTTVPNYYSQENKEGTIKNMSITHEEGVIRHETQKNITTPFIHGGKAMSDLKNKTNAKDDSSNKNQFQSTQTTISGNDEVKITTADSNIDMMTTTVPNYYYQENKEGTIKNMSITHEEGVVRHETQKNITTPLIHGGKAMSDLNNKSYAKEDKSSKNQFQSTQTTNSGNVEVIVTTTESNIITPSIHGGKVMSDLNNKGYLNDNDSKSHYQSTQTSNQFNFRKNGVKGELTFKNSTNNFEGDKIIVLEHNTTITKNVPDLMFTKVDNSGLTTNLNHADTFVSTFDSNTRFTKSYTDIDRVDISDRLTIITHKNLQETKSTNINDYEMTSTQITNNLAIGPTRAPINVSKISPETKSSAPVSIVKGTTSVNRYFVKSFGDGKLEKNDNPFSNIDQEISSRTNRQAENQKEIFKLRVNQTTNNYNITTILSEISTNSSKKYGKDLTATTAPNHTDVKVLPTISEDFNSYTLKEIGITEKYTMLPVIDAKDLTTVAEDFFTTVTTASYNLPKKISTTSISKESMSGDIFVNNGRERTLSSSSIMNTSTNIPQYDETIVVESKSLQTNFPQPLNIEADTTMPSSQSDNVTSVLNRVINSRDVNKLKKKSQKENYQSAGSTALLPINLTSLSLSPLNNKILRTSVTKTSVETESVTDISTNQPQLLKKTEVSSKNNSYKTDKINENKPNIGIIKSIQSRDINESKVSTTSKGLRLNEKFRNEAILNNNQQPDMIPSELSIKVGSNIGLHASTTEQYTAQKNSKHFTDIKPNSTSRFLRRTTPTHYASSTIPSLEMSDRSITTAKIKKNTATTIRNTNEMSDATLITDSTINKRKKKTKTNDIAEGTLLENMHESDGNVLLMKSNKYKGFSNISISNMTIDADRQTDSKLKELNKNLETTNESTKFIIINGQNSYKDMSVNSNYHDVSNDPQRVPKHYSNSTRGSIKTTTKNTTTMAKQIRDVNAKSTNTAPTNIIVILFDYGKQTQKKEGKSAANDTNFEENPDDNIKVESSSHNRYENSNPNDIKAGPMTNTNNADNDNDPQNSPTPKVDVRVNETDMVLCGRYARGRYPDNNDCRKFYICVGRNPPIKGICPNNTVYSESRKQCTRNLSHCVRNNKFKCLTEGRFSDFSKDDIYHVCIKNKLGDFIVYNFQCQNGFRLNKKFVECIKETENTSSSISSASQSSKSNKKSTTEKTSKVIDKFECQEEGKFADTRDCRTYYVCSKKRNVYRRKKKKCESDELFDRVKKKCVDAESYECDI